MIANITTGNNVYNMVNYNHKKENEELDGEKKGLLLGVNNISSNDFNTIVETISLSNNRNLKVSKPNIHISISFHKEDILDNETIYKIGEEYMQKMGYSDQPYAIYRHFDKEHPHIHVVTSQIDMFGKFIRQKEVVNGNIKYKKNYFVSQKISRELEDMYEITKAVEKKENFDNIDLSTAVNEHLEHGNHSLAAIMRKIIYEVLDKKPLDENQFDKLLEEYQLRRIVIYDKNDKPTGNYFDLCSFENLGNECSVQNSSHRLNGSDLSSLLSVDNLHDTILNFKLEKENGLKNMMGRVYSVINPINANFEAISTTKKLSDLIVDFKKKGIELQVKRSQTGNNPNAIYGLLFKSIDTEHIYSASELKIKTINLLKIIEDDLKMFPKESADPDFSKLDANPKIEYFKKNITSKNLVIESSFQKDNCSNSLSLILDMFSSISSPTQEPTENENKRIQKRKRRRS